MRISLRASITSGGLLAALLLLAPGCRPAECRQMTECCATIGGEDGVGEACGAMSESTSNPDTCRSVLETVAYMYEDRKKPVPPVCKMP